jgi:glucose/arabinose dehydrogenase
MSLSSDFSRFAAQAALVRPLLAGVVLAILAGCGGGGGGGAPPPPSAVNQAPTFTSSGSIAVAENSGGSIYQATATDPEGAPVTFSISGGADAARFIIGSTGQLNFAAPPNFDLPADSDGNNVYVVELTASDGVGRGTLTLSVTVTNSKEGVAVRRIATGFVTPAAMSAVSDTALLVVEKNGAIYYYNLQNGSRQLLEQVSPTSGLNVLAIAAAPDFASKGRFMVMYTVNGFLVVHEYLRNPAGPTVPNFFGPLLQISAPDYAGGGWLGYGTDGNLLIATGDAGGTGDPSGSAQSDSSFLGKIIRVIPNADPFGCAAACFYSFSRIAKGLHQPVGGFVYSAGLLIGDRGQAAADEVDFFPAGASGVNFGWPFKEGFRIVQGTPPANVVDPVTEYARPGGSAVQGIVGGAIGGSFVPSLSGHYVFADRSGAIFSFPTASLQNARTATERRTADFEPDAGAIEQPVAVIADSAGRLYILDADGEIFRVDAG